MRKNKTIRVILYALFLFICVKGSYDFLSGIPYLKEYLEGFMTRDIEIESTKQDYRVLGKKRVKSHYIDDSLVVILDIQNCHNPFEFLPELIDSIMIHEPTVLGIDVDFSYRTHIGDSISILLNTIKKYNNIVLVYDQNKINGRYPFGLSYHDFANLGYANFEAFEAMPRYLMPYAYDKIDGETRTSFWARLWEIHANIPPGQLKSKRTFINFNLRPLVWPVDEIYDFQLIPPRLVENHIIIIGQAKNIEDIFHVPIDDPGSTYPHRYLMDGVEVIGKATMTIGDNELENDFLDRNRVIFGILCYIILTALFCFIHFNKKCNWLRETGNIWQCIAAIALFLVSKCLSPSKDEWWYLFSIIAVFLLIAPVTADIETVIYRMYRCFCLKIEKRKHDSK